MIITLYIIHKLGKYIKNKNRLITSFNHNFYFNYPNTFTETSWPHRMMQEDVLPAFKELAQKIIWRHLKSSTIPCHMLQKVYITNQQRGEEHQAEKSSHRKKGLIGY